MSNKKVFKKLYSKYLNKEKNYEKILDAIEEDKKNVTWVKWMFVSYCLVVTIICGILAVRSDNMNLMLSKSEIDEEKNTNCSVANKNVILNINQVDREIDLSMADADVKKVSNYYNIPYYEVLSHLVIPEDFDNKEYVNAIYTRSNRNTKEYDYLMQYEKIYKNNSNNRNIVVAFSDKNEPMRDYEFTDGKTSTINGFEMVIYKYENLYMTKFHYKDLYIDIETSGITEDELVNLLQSIIK